MGLPLLLGSLGIGAVAASMTGIKLAEQAIIPVLNIRQVCKMLNMSEPTVRRYIKGGELSPTIPFNKKAYEFDRDDVISFAKKKNIILNTEGVTENDMSGPVVPGESKASLMLKKAEGDMNTDNKPSKEQFELILSALTNEKETLELVLESLSNDDTAKDVKNDILQVKLFIKSKIDEILYCKYLMTQV